MSDKPTTDSLRWQRIQDLFHAALELDGAARNAYLAVQCGDDLTLHLEIEQLLTGHTQSDGALSQVVVAVADYALGTLGDRLIGKRIGAYELSSQIGVGGMGSVYLGKRVDGHYRQQVAIKLINPAVLSEQVLQRFRAERQILADLEHPNIARLLDGGSTGDGFPYLVLEYVDGVPIDEYCVTHRLNAPARLELFRSVCAAVHYAHGQLVVHRDLKPSNILVTAHGIPKLLDFGIAKLLDDGVDPRTSLTVGVRPMTPQYASPEQVRGGRISTATDVYALGVLLYKLLTGRLPFDAQTSPGTSLEQLICDSEPLAPSLTVGEAHAGSTRMSDAPRMRKALKGDLDNIVLMALRKEPERRYSSAEQFSEDIRRHLVRMPVLARPASVRYRALRFGQRHWAALVTTLTVVVLIVGLVSFYTARLGAQRDVAQRNAQRAERVAGLLTGIFELSDPDETRGRDVTAREILDSGAERVERELAGQPDTLAAMLTTIATVYHGLGLYEKAANMHSRALELRRALPQTDAADIAESLLGLGRNYYELGKYEDGVRVTAEALDIQRRRLPADSTELAGAISGLGFQTFQAGKLPEAEALYDEAMSVFAASGEKDSDAYIGLLMNVAQLRETQGDFESSSDTLYSVLDILENKHGSDYSQVATALHNLGVSLHQQRRFDEAEKAYRRSLEITRQLYDDNHPDLGATLGALGRMHHEKGDYAGAEPYYREALAHSRRVLGNEHAYTGYDLANLASLLLDRENYSAADEAYVEVLQIYSRSLPPNHPYVASVLIAYARLLNETQRVDRAIEVVQRALKICAAELDPDHWLAATGQTVLGQSLVLAGRPDEAASLLPPGYRRLIDARGQNDPRTQRALDWTVALLRSQGQNETADNMLREAAAGATP